MMSTKHEATTFIDSRDTLNSLKIVSDLTTSSRDRLVRVSISDGRSPAVVLTKQQVHKLIDVLTFHAEGSAYIDHRSNK